MLGELSLMCCSTSRTDPRNLHVHSTFSVGFCRSSTLVVLMLCSTLSAIPARYDRPTRTPTLGCVVRLLDERCYDPPRAILVELDGQWWPGTQTAWRLCNDSRGWMADVRWSALHTWGLGTYLTMVAPERIRLPADADTVDNPRPVDDSRRRSPVT